MPKPNQELREKLLYRVKVLENYARTRKKPDLDVFTDQLLNLIELEKVQARIDECKTGDSPEEWRQYRLSQLEAQKKELV